MVCGQIHIPTTLPNYVHVHLMNKELRRQAAILETWYVYYALLFNRGPFVTCSRYVSSVGEVYGTPFPSQNNPSHSVTVARDLTRVLKWTKHQLSFCHNLPMLNRFFHASRTFSSDYAPLQYENTKQDAYQNK